MNTNENNTHLIIDFIGTIWNESRFDQLDNFLHTDFIDHSLPTNVPANAAGLKLWVIGTGQAFEHRTIIEEQVTENNKSIIKIRMLLTHIGNWRDIAATGLEISTIGYRNFKIQDGKIIEHWALIDGNTIENQLKNSVRGCKVQE